MTTPELDFGAPLAMNEGKPALYGALGAIFHLEKLGPDDEEKLDRANDLIWDWIGPELHATSLSCAVSYLPTSRAHLDYIATYASHLEAPTHADPLVQRMLSNHTKFGRNDYEVSCYGATIGLDPEESAVTSPYSCTFWAEIGEVTTTSPLLDAYSTLRLTVPEAWPLPDFFNRISALAALLPLRWGAAGYTYAPQPLQHRDPINEGLFAHARRHLGYDVGFHVRLVEPFYRKIRSVNWLTFLGPQLLEGLPDAARRLTSTPNVRVAPAGPATLLQAGASPERGDINRLQIPVAYREADAMVRPLRHAGGRGMDFLDPWDDTTTTAWLRRFERRGGLA